MNNEQFWKKGDYISSVSFRYLYICEPTVKFEDLPLRKIFCRSKVKRNY